MSKKQGTDDSLGNYQHRFLSWPEKQLNPLMTFIVAATRGLVSQAQILGQLTR
jgi:hypothetical protein